MSLKSIWVIGDWQEPVFDAAMAWLRSNADCQCFESSAAAGGGSSNGRYPQAIVFVQSRAGQISVQCVESFHAREPLARLIALTGPWCEGEQRSGRPIPGVVRVPWRNWRETLAIELGIGSDDAPSPRTITQADRFDKMAQATSIIRARPGHIAICTASLSNYCYLADAVGQIGRIPVRHGGADSPSAEAVVFDGWEQAGAFKRQSASENGQACHPQILLLHFPRPEDHARARNAGIDAVLAHPLALADLQAALSAWRSEVA